MLQSCKRCNSGERDDTEDNWKVYTFINDDRYGSTFFWGLGDADFERFELLLDMSNNEMEAHSDDEWLTHAELGYWEAEEAEEDNEDDEMKNVQEDGGDEVDDWREDI